MRLPASNRRFAKIVVTLERREDGGLRAYSEDVPGFVLSNHDPSVVLSDIAIALETILSSMADDSAGAVAPATEIEVTSEMIEAGERELLAWEAEADYSSRRLVKRIFLAMREMDKRRVGKT